MVSLVKKVVDQILVFYWLIEMAQGPGLKLVFTRFLRRLSFKGWMALQFKGLKHIEKRMYFSLPS